MSFWKFGAVVACGCLLAAAPPERFSIDAMQHIVGLSDATISPDGSQVAFVASHVNLEHNRSDDTVELYVRATGAKRELAAGHRSVSGLAWSPDGTQLAAVLDVPKEDASQIFLIDPSSGKETKLTTGKTSPESIAWSPDGKSIAFLRAEYVAPKTGEAQYRDGYEVTDNAYLSTKPARSSHIWIVGLDGSERRITSGSWNVVSSPLSWSADGKSLLYERVASPIYGLQDRAVSMHLDLATGRSTPATAHKIYEDQAMYSPDGRHIAYLYSRGGDPMSAAEAYIDERDLTLKLDRQISTIAWMPDSASMLLNVYDRTQAPLYLLRADGSTTRLPLGGVLEASIASQGSVARDGTIAFIGTEARRPNEVYVLTPGAKQPQRISGFNDATAALDLGKPVRIAWTGPRGFHEDGVITYPPGYVAGRKYPLVVRIHGGPTESSFTSFSSFYQLTASHGYVVFAPNYRGSNDLGNAYQHAILDDASQGPGEDIMAGIRAVERLGIVDRKRIAVSGWSYGGQLTSWMEGHYHIWKAAVAGAAVNDLVVDYSIADDIDADAISFSGGSPFKGNSLEAWRRASPITYFKNIRTPTLIFCNVYDVRVPIPESYEMYHALRDNGVPVKFYAYPTTGHLPNGPVRVADVYEKWMAWFDRYLK